MRVDLYTKTVLTVIAVCLVWLVVGKSSVVPAVQAQDRTPTRVVIVGVEGNGGGSGRVQTVLSGWRDESGNVHAFPRPETSGRREAAQPLPVVQ